MKKLIREPCLWMVIVFFIMIAIQVLLPPGAHACSKLKGWSGISWGTKIENVETEMVLSEQTTHEVNGKAIKLISYHMVGKEHPKYIVGLPQFLFIDDQFAFVSMAINDREFLDGMIENFDEGCGELGIRQEKGVVWESKRSTIHASTTAGKLGVLIASTSGYEIFVAIMIDASAKKTMEGKRAL